MASDDSDCIPSSLEDEEEVSDSDYIPSSSEEEEEVSDSEIEEDEDEKVSDEEEEGSDMDRDTVDDIETEFNLRNLKDQLEARGSNKITEIMNFAVSENDVIADIYNSILKRLDQLNQDDGKTPSKLVKHSKDMWIHILEVISDHIEDATAMAKRC